MPRYILIFLFFSFPGTLFANIEFTANCKEAYVQMFSMHFEEANKNIELEKLKNPENQFVIYLEHYLSFLEVIITDDIELYRNILDNSNEMFNKIRNEHKNLPWKNYILAEMHLQQAILAHLNEKKLKTAINIYRSYQSIEINKVRFPGFEMNKKIDGFFYLLFSLIPDDYKWLSDFFGIKGDYKYGIIQLDEYCMFAMSNQIFQIEGFIIEYFLKNLEEENLELNNDYLNELKTFSASNSLVRYIICSSLIVKGENDIVNKMLFENHQSEDEQKIIHLNYLKGISLLYNDNIETEMYLNTFIDNYNGRFYKNSARLKLAWFYLLNDNEDKYDEIIADILKTEINILESDKQAYKEAKYKKNTNRILLKSRILFDGGNYTDGINLLKSNSNLLQHFSKYEKVEYYYRLARSYQMNKINKLALKHFDYVIRNGENINDYYYAYSLLNIGNIQKYEGDRSIAKFYYIKCKEISAKSYSYSFEYKVNKALKEIVHLEESSLVIHK